MMTLDEYKKRAVDYLQKNNPTFMVKECLPRIEKESEEFLAESWEPEAMVQAMTSGLV